MKLHVQWDAPVPLRRTSRSSTGYTIDLEVLPEDPGVYVFGRWHGKTFEALYIGRAANIRRRVKQHLNSLRLMEHLRTASNGQRVLIAGCFVPRPGQSASRCLPIVERALIRHFLTKGDDLVNRQGTTLRRHEVDSSRRQGWFLPLRVYAER